jgi:hypothetical protein
MQLNEIHNEHENASVSLKVLLLIFGILLVGALGYLVYQQYYSDSTVTESESAPSVTTDESTTEEVTESDSWKTYTDTTYDFSLTFGDIWEGYKVKTVTPADGSAVAYLYFNMPTADAEYATATTATDAAQASIFSIGVYTPAQWGVIEAVGTATSTVISVNTDTNYVFTYGNSQAYPEALSANATDVATVIATFKNAN